MPELVATPDEEQDWRKQAPVLKVRVPAPKKAAEEGGSSAAGVPRVVARKESPYMRKPEDIAASNAKAEASAPAPAPVPKVVQAAVPAPDPEKVAELAQSAFDELKKLQEKFVNEAVEAAKPLTADATNVTQEKAVEAAQATEAAVAKGVLAAQASARAVSERVKEMGNTEVAKKTKGSVEFLALQGKIKHCRKKMEELRAAVAAMRQRTDEKGAKAVIQEAFDKYDEDKDGCLKKEEVAAFVKGEYSVDPSDDMVEKILRVLASEEPGVLPDNIPRLRAMVAIDKASASADERQRKQAEAQELASEVEKELREAEAAATKTKDLANALASKLLVQVRAAVEEVESSGASAKELVEKVEGLVEKLQKQEEGQDEVVRAYRQDLATKFSALAGVTKALVEATGAPVEKAKKRFKQAAIAETEALRLQVAMAVRGVMQAKKKTGEKMFQDAAKKADELKQEQFVDFVKSLADHCPSEALPESLRKDAIDTAKVEALFSHVAAADSLSKERFLWLFTCLGYIVVKETGLKEEQKAEEEKAKRQLEVGELLEALALSETTEEGGAKSIRVRACKDGAEGWATISGADAEDVRLVQASNAFTCVKETILTGALKISEGETVRRVTRGEIVEALAFEKRDDACGVMRVECKAIRDGKTGWVSVAGNTGLAFLERLR